MWQQKVMFIYDNTDLLYNKNMKMNKNNKVIKNRRYSKSVHISSFS